MAYTTINKSTDYFNTKLYTGTGSSNAITGVGHQPDFTWIKSRNSSSYNNMLFDSVRGATKYVKSDGNHAENTLAESLKSFDTDGFTVGTESDVNNNSTTYVAWNWKANGQGSSNTAGTINTTYTSVNTTAGFSIIQYTGNGYANATIGHGLGVEPSMILFKRTDSSNNWIVYHKSMGTGHYLTLNTNGTKDSASGAWCTPSSTLIQLNQVFGATNTNGATYIAYCFAEKIGYSKIGEYQGNGSSEGPFVFTGFKPSFIFLKNTSSSNSWEIRDNKRQPFADGNGKRLFPDSNSAESSNTEAIEKLSTGFKIYSTGSGHNTNNNDYIYLAIGQSLVGSNNIPVMAG
jgi:hypothetical protein